jgi:gliding motility-associated-like protein
MRNKILIFFLLLTSICHGQLQVSGAMTPTQLVNNILLGPGVQAFNITYTGSNQSIGFFNGVNSNIGLDSGLLICNGKITTAVGPNTVTDAGLIPMGTPGDSDLTSIGGTITKDAAVLEFDFIPSSDSVFFNYVFGSEEYFEGVCTPYNDVFAFLISGPSIIGVQNIALVPNTSYPVTISSINSGLVGSFGGDSSYSFCHLNNTQYYVDNVSPPGATVQYDGFTTVLTAKAAVLPCQTYHIKLAIADGGNDDTWDSGVFLEAGSFNSHVITLSTYPQLVGAAVDTSTVEGCGSADIIFKRYDSIAYPRTLNYTLSGTATPNVDYTLSSPVIQFAAGQDTTHIILTPLTDMLNEGVETVKLTIVPDFIICTNWDTAFVRTSIIDPPPITVNATAIVGICPVDSINLIGTAQGSTSQFNYVWTWTNNSLSGNNVWVQGGSSTQYILTATEICSGQSATASVIAALDCSFDIPNVFSPNGDGVNDNLVFSLPGNTKVDHLIIYNRWGGKVYEANNYDNSWNAPGVSDGTYYIYAEFSGNQTKTGFITIIR